MRLGTCSKAQTEQGSIACVENSNLSLPVFFMSYHDISLGVAVETPDWKFHSSFANNFQCAVLLRPNLSIKSIYKVDYL